ncbi:MAG: hypothetical protein ABWX89_00165 [Paeniglutamicibacter terrestris]
MADIVVLSTAIQDGLQTIHMPAVAFKLTKEQIDSAGNQLLNSLKAATNYLDPHSRPGLKTDFEYADQRLLKVEFDQESLIAVFKAPLLRKKRTPTKRKEARPGE